MVKRLRIINGPRKRHFWGDIAKGNILYWLLLLVIIPLLELIMTKILEYEMITAKIMEVDHQLEEDSIVMHHKP